VLKNPLDGSTAHFTSSELLNLFCFLPSTNLNIFDNGYLNGIFSYSYYDKNGIIKSI